MGIAALPVSVWLVAAALLLSEDSPAALVPVVASVAVLPVVEAEVVKVAPVVDATVEAEAEAPVVAEAPPVPVAVTVTGMNAPGNSVKATAEFIVVVKPRSSRLTLQVTLTESYEHLSATVL